MTQADYDKAMTSLRADIATEQATLDTFMVAEQVNACPECGALPRGIVHGDGLVEIACAVHQHTEAYGTDILGAVTRWNKGAALWDARRENGKNAIRAKLQPMPVLDPPDKDAS